MNLGGWHQIGCYRMTTFDYKIATKWFKWYALSKIDNEYRKGVFDHLTSKNDKAIVMEGLSRVFSKRFLAEFILTVVEMTFIEAFVITGLCLY